MKEFLILSFSDVYSKLLSLAEKIKESKYEPEVIIGIVRGGIIPARLLSDFFNCKEIYFISTEYYASIGETLSEPKVKYSILPEDISHKRILVIDDVADSGNTLKLISKFFKDAKEVRFATLYLKPKSSFIPDYYLEVTDKWIVFPWEYKEFSDKIELPLEIKEKLSRF